MIVATYLTDSHKQLYEEFFEPSATKNGWEIYKVEGPQVGCGHFGEPDWPEMMRRKARAMYDAICTYPNEIILYADCDIYFARDFNCKKLLGDNLLAAQVSDRREMCAGLMIINCTQEIKRMYRKIYRSKRFYQPGNLMSDQDALNHFVKKDKIPRKLIPRHLFWCPAIVKRWERWQEVDSIEQIQPIPKTILAAHANWCRGLELKKEILNYVKQCIN